MELASYFSTCAGIHGSTTLLRCNKVWRLSFNCLVTCYVGPNSRDWIADKEMLYCSVHDLQPGSVVGTEVPESNGEGVDCVIHVSYVKTTSAFHHTFSAEPSV